MAKITKADIRKWLEEKQEEVQGKAMNAEERGNDEGFTKWDEKNDQIIIMLESLEEL